MPTYDSIDYFSDQSLVEDPYPYFDHLRSRCPVLPTANHGVVAVSGYDEASEIYLDSDTFSSCNSVIGPFATFPVPLEGDDVSEIIDRHRGIFVGYHKLRTRRSGGGEFIDFHLQMRSDMPLKDAHDQSDSIVVDIKRDLPRAHVLIHLEPEE